jgi:hypothetical protein
MNSDEIAKRLRAANHDGWHSGHLCVRIDGPGYDVLDVRCERHIPADAIGTACSWPTGPWIVFSWEAVQSQRRRQAKSP